MITSPNVIATPMCPSWWVLASTMIAPAPAKTSAKVPTNSAASRRMSTTVCRSARGRGRCGVGEQLRDQLADAPIDLVADPAHGLEVLTGGIVELPVFVPLPRVDRADVAAAHRDHDVGGSHELVGQRLGELLAHVDAE